MSDEVKDNVVEEAPAAVVSGEEAPAGEASAETAAEAAPADAAPAE